MQLQECAFTNHYDNGDDDDNDDDSGNDVDVDDEDEENFVCEPVQSGS